MMRTDYIIDITKQLIEKTGTRDPQAICEFCGIRLRFKDLEDKVKGYHAHRLRKEEIIINENEPEEYQKMLIAHELGHSLLHKNKRSGHGYHQFEEENEMKSIEEHEANLFAAELLLDNEETYQLLHEHTISHTAKILHVPKELVTFKLQILKKDDKYQLGNIDVAKSTFLKD